MYGHEQTKREVIYNEYKPDVERLMRYLPWLARTSSVRSYYEGDLEHPVIKIPVFDSIFLQFVKEVEKTRFVNKNYPYIYTRYRIKTPEDERKAMENAKITDIHIFEAVLSKYVLLGKRRAATWSESITEEIFLTALRCLKELFYSYSPDGKE